MTPDEFSLAFSGFALGFAVAVAFVQWMEHRRRKRNRPGRAKMIVAFKRHIDYCEQVAAYSDVLDEVLSELEAGR